jgi:hypothetical protein
MMGMGMARGWEGETVKGKVLLNKPQREMIYPLPLRHSWRTQCIRHTGTRRANYSGYSSDQTQHLPCPFSQMMKPTQQRSQMAKVTYNINLMKQWACRMMWKHRMALI